MLVQAMVAQGQSSCTLVAFTTFHPVTLHPTSLWRIMVLKHALCMLLLDFLALDNQTLSDPLHKVWSREALCKLLNQFIFKQK